MLPIEIQLQNLRAWSEAVEDGVLSIYADIDPSKPENAGRAWLKRIKNSLMELPEISDRQGKRDQPLYDRVMNLLEAERPQARTLALFAHRNQRGELSVERLDLQIELPVIDLARGRVEVRYGAPYLAPLWFAVDEYQRVGILVLSGGGWRLFEVFLGEVREDQETFISISPEEWKALQEASRKLSSVWHARSSKPGGLFDKLSPRERANARIQTWMHKLYSGLARLLTRAVDHLSIERLVMVGEHLQVSHFETYLSHRLQQRIVARLPLPQEAQHISGLALWRQVEPVLTEAERKSEMELLRKIRQQPGIWGVDAVLNALQMGQVKQWVLPWSLELTLWRCPQDGVLVSTQEAAKKLCSQPEPISLREHVLNLAAEHGAEVEFVRGEAEQCLLREMGGMAALLRWS